MNRRRTGATAPKPRSQRERTPELFFNRELSWLAFNERVAEEAADKSNPLIERAKFAAIVASNLDEFFMVRVARLRNAIDEGDTEPDPAGLTPAQQLRQVSARVHALVVASLRAGHRRTCCRPSPRTASGSPPRPISTTSGARRSPRTSATTCCRCSRRWPWTPSRPFPHAVVAQRQPGPPAGAG